MSQLEHRVKIVWILLALLVAGGGSLSAQQLVATPNPNPFTVTASNAAGSAQVGTITFSSTGAGIAWTLNLPIVYGQPAYNNWLFPSRTNGSTLIADAATTAVSINVLGFPAGLYTATLNFGGTIIGTSTAVAPVSVVVTVNVTAGGTGTGVLSASPSSLSLSAAVGSSASAPLSISTSSAGTVTLQSIQPITDNGIPWLSVNQATGSVSPGQPFTFNVSATSLPPGSAGLTAGTYTGRIRVTPLGGTPLDVSVTFTVGTTSAFLTANPTSVTFNTQVGVNPPVRIVTLTSSLGAVGATITVSPAVTWLTVFPSGATTIPVGGLGVQLQANVAGLTTSQQYTTNIIVSSATAGTLTIPVTLTLGGAAELTVTPSRIAFYYQVGTAVPSPQPVIIDSTTGAQLTWFFSQVGGGILPSWLVPSFYTGTTPQTVNFSLNSTVLSGLAPGTYQAQVQVSGTYQGVAIASKTLMVDLLVSTNPLLTASPASVAFTLPLGGVLPGSQQVAVSTSNLTALPFNAVAVPTSGGNWFQVSPASGTTPSNLSISLTSTATTLLPGEYTGNVTVSSAGAGNTLQIPVTLRVTSEPALAVSPRRLTFNYQTTQSAPPTQFLNVTSTGVPLVFSGTVTTASGGNWLTVTTQLGAQPIGVSTPATLFVGIVTTGLQPGTYQGTITLTPSGSSVPTTVQVVLNVSSTALINFSPSELVFNYTPGSGTFPANQILSLTSTDLTAVAFTAATPPANFWLFVTPTGGSTPANLTVGATNLAILAAGVYDSSVTITYGGRSFDVPVRLNVGTTTAATVSVSPTTLAFEQAQNGPAPAAKQVTVTAAGLTGTASVTFTAGATTSIGGNWLAVSPTSGVLTGSTTSAVLSVTVSAAGLTPGTYFGTITVSPVGLASQSVQVALTVTTAQTLSVSATSLSFTGLAGGTAPATQAINVTSTTPGLAFTVAATTTTGGSWLSANPSSGNTNASVNVSVSLTGLAAGVYSGELRITATGAANSPVKVSVTLTVSAPPVGPIRTVANAATGLPTALAPGLIISIFGSNLGPSQGTQPPATANPIPTTVGGVRVLFDGIAAPLLFVRNDQINAVVPYAMYGRFSTRMRVEYQGNLSDELTLRVDDGAPGIFCSNGQGFGQAAALNTNLSVNGAGNPVDRGGVIVLYATGEGQTNPAGVDGRVYTAAPLPAPLQPVRVTIGGQEAEVLYAGTAPQLVSGALQVNARVPSNINAGNAVSVILTIGNRTSQTTATIAVR